MKTSTATIGASRRTGKTISKLPAYKATGPAMSISFKRILRLAAIHAYQLVSHLIPKQNNLVAFMSYPDFSDNSWHLFKHISQCSHEYKIVWLTTNEPSHKTLEQNNSKPPHINIIYARKKSMKGIYYFLRSKYVFHTHGTYWFAKTKTRSIMVNLWHGMPLKKIGLLDNKSKEEVDVSDYIIATSNLFASIMAKSFGVSESAVLVTGLPRNDALLSPATSKKKVLEALNQSHSEDLIVWLPTYRSSNVGDIRKDSSASSFIAEWPLTFLEELDTLLKKNKITLVIKLHPMDTLNEQKQRPFEHILFLTSSAWQSIGLDLYDCLGISAGLVSDFSSVIIDFSLTGKPIGITENSYKDYSRGIIKDININAISYSKLTNINEFAGFITACKQKNINPSNKSKWHQHIDDRSCSRIYESILRN